MITEKKNQHYIPKFYLRNFSCNNNGKQIGVFNVDNEIYIKSAKLKTQGSKNFFYGYDGLIEDRLADIEGELAPIIKSIIDTKTLPPRDSKEHFFLLGFVILTNLRNPVKIEYMKNSMIEMKRRLLEMDPNVDIDKFAPDISHEEVVKMSLSNVVELIENITDLEYKLLINETSTPFITSDFPIVKYNQFLESKNWPLSRSGYCTVGLQIFIPLNSKILIMLYDSGIYRLGNRKQKCFSITKPQDIDEINILNFLNCFNTIFFDDKASEKYIRRLLQKSEKYKRANVTTSELSYVSDQSLDKHEIERTVDKNLIILGSTGCNTKLTVDGLKVHAKGQSYKFDNSAVQPRPHNKRLMRNDSNPSGTYL